MLQGHPDAQPGHLAHALALAYAEAARAAGHQVFELAVGAIDFPLLRSKRAWESEPLPPSLVPAQALIRDAEHLVIIFPLWLGDMPAVLKGFFEQVARPGFALGEPQGPARLPKKLLAGRSARVVVTMGMPAFVYRWLYGAHSVRSLERNILRFVGIRPVRTTLFGGVESAAAQKVPRMVDKMRRLGSRAG